MSDGGDLSDEGLYREFLWGIGVTDAGSQAALWAVEKKRRAAARAKAEAEMTRWLASHPI